MPTNVNLRELGEALHSRLIAGNDNRVTAEIAENFLRPLAQRLRGRFPRLNDPHVVESAAIDSLLAYFDRPSRFNPAKASLLQYLFIDARCNVIDYLRSKGAVELPLSQIEYSLDIVSTEDIESALAEQESPALQQVLSLVHDERDLRIVTLMIEGVRETSAYASVLGIEELTSTEQKAIVKRHKDRLKKVLQGGIKRGVERAYDGG